MDKTQKNSDKYHRILDSAVKIFADQGFHTSTISQIAREAGVADGTIYLYFKNKQDILFQFFNYKTKQVFDAFQQEVDQKSQAIDKLKCLIRCHFEKFQQDRNMALVYRAETRQCNQLMEDQIKEMTKMYLDILSSIIEQGQEEGTMRHDLFMGLVKRFILGAVEEVINVWVISGGNYDLTSQADPLVDLFLNGIGSK